MNTKLLLFVAMTLIQITAYSETEPNNTMEQANTLLYNGSESGTLTGTDTEDWFVINVPQGGIFTLKVIKTGAGNGNLYLYDGEGNGYPEITNLYLGYGDSPGSGWAITVPLLRGKYYAKFNKGSDPVNYQVEASLASPAFAEDAEPNDILTNAIAMPVNGSVSGNLHYYAVNKGYDLEDWYKIQIPQGGILTLKINKKGAGNTWLRFLDGKKTGNPEISNFYAGYSESPEEGWTWSYPVLAGDYYFQVEGGGGVVDYKLDVSLTAPAFAEDTEPNDTITKALTMPVNGSVTGNLHYYIDGKGDDMQDWFKIQIPQGGILNIKINKKGPGNTWIKFLDGIKTGHPEISNFYVGYSESPEEGWTWSYPVLAGDYYFQVDGGGGVLDYKLDVSLTAPAFAEDTEPNDTITKALTMPVNGSVTGNLHYYIDGKGDDTQDWFKIQIPKGGILNLKINKKGPGNTWIKFRDGIKTGNPEISNFYVGYSDSPDEGWTWSNPVLAGDYYFQVEGGGGILDYKLDVSLAAPAFAEDTEPNDTITKALTMPTNGSVTGTLHYYIDGKDRDWQDWYKIEIPQGGILNLKIHKKGAENTWIRFRDAIKKDNPEISEFYIGYSESPEEGWTWSYPVLAGIYYFQIEGGQGILDYKLDSKLTLPPWGEDTEPNDSIEIASNFQVNDSISGLLGYYKSGLGIDDWDWYAINAKEYGHLSFNIDKKGDNNCNIRLRDTIDEIASQYLGFGDLNVVFGKLIPAGKYYLGFEKYGGNLQYKVRMKLTPKPKADFTIIQTDNSFAFENKTQDGETYEWNFDDETKEATVNPIHEYLNPGNYNVSLIAKNVAGTDTIRKMVVVPGLDRIYPNKGGNAGDVTIQAFGGGLDTTYMVKIMNDGEVIATAGFVGLSGKSSISARFDLRKKPAGTYDVIVEKDGGPSYKVSGGFKIIAGEVANPWVDIVGRDAILFNGTQTYNITYGNNANVDASGVPLWIVVSDDPGIEVNFKGFELELPKVAIDNGWSRIKDSIPIYYTVDNLFGEAFKARVYGFYIPIIPAGQTESVKMIIHSNQNVRVMAWVNTPYFQSPLSEDYKTCVALAAAKLLASGIGLVSPIDGCVHSVVTNYIYDPWSYKQPPSAAPKTWGSSLWNLATTALSCAGAFTPMGVALNFAVNLTNLASDFQGAWAAANACKDAYGQKSRKDKSIRAVSSLDPNEKTGPTGFGPENYIAATRNMPYTIYFENKATATAPAHIVSITDQLDKTKFDLSSFSFGNVYVGDTLIPVKPGLQEFVVDKKFGLLNVVARVSGKLDTITGNVEWKLRSLDPTTLDDVEDPYIGLLPPNAIPPQGEGNVSYFVRLKSDPVHKFSVANQASIVFDGNPAIVTNKHLTTFDLVAPTSSVQPLLGTTNTPQFEVKWTGTDDGSGIQSYNIYVKTGDDPYNIWLSGVTETSAIFNSLKDATYQFSSVAIDKTGNIEMLPEIPDVTTNVVTGINDLGLTGTAIKVYQNSPNHELVIDIKKAGTFRLQIFGVDGSLKVEKMMNGNSITSIKTGPLTQGLYIWQLVDQASSFIRTGKFVENK